ncbi:MAG: hypothetical protein IKB72_00230, partial [Ruminococcus sp.]|nr:hypothetical protein [Ruminococcus sp.]
LAAVLTLAMIGSYIIAINTSLEKIPLISMALNIAEEGEADEEFEEIMDNLSYEIARGRAKLESARYECTEEEYKLLCEFWDVAEKCAKNFSITNIKKFADKTEEISNSYILKDYTNLSSSSVSDDIDDINTVVDAATAVILGFMIFALCFTVPGAFCKIKGLVIAGLVLTIIYSLVFCPVWVTLLLIALHITMIVFISIVKNEYKEYTRNPEAYAQKKA